MPENNIWKFNMPLSRFTNLITRSYYGALTKKLEHLDIEHYYTILITIEEQKGSPCSQQSLCDLLQVDKASMVKKIDYLAKKGLVKRTKNPKDRREHRICLTEKAFGIMPEIHNAVNELNTKATQGMTPEQTKDFFESLWKVYDNISAQPAHDVAYKINKVKKSLPK